MQPITLGGETFQVDDDKLAEIKKQLQPEKKKGVVIHKTDGSVLYESAADTIKGAVEEATLRGVDLYRANLRGANLRGADLYGADLYEANLRDANLRKAELYNAKF
jgi:uncharacterized protein YjbI with pentapeptide repeats